MELGPPEAEADEHSPTPFPHFFGVVCVPVPQAPKGDKAGAGAKKPSGAASKGGKKMDSDEAKWEEEYRRKKVQPPVTHQGHTV